MRPRLITVFLSVIVTMLVWAPLAAATTYSGEGLYGETNDVVITNTMFGVIIFFPVVIIVFSLIQSYLDKRKHARMDAAKARATSAEWHGGW